MPFCDTENDPNHLVDENDLDYLMSKNDLDHLKGLWGAELDANATLQEFVKQNDEWLTFRKFPASPVGRLDVDIASDRQTKPSDETYYQLDKLELSRNAIREKRVQTCMALCGLGNFCNDGHTCPFLVKAEKLPDMPDIGVKYAPPDKQLVTAMIARILQCENQELLAGKDFLLSVETAYLYRAHGGPYMPDEFELWE
ncbi:hypothetical protein FWH58_00060 [Candidatus Saccharibacteria bacterium]|nr:hypothetical protein [Candidatus Saccharibacteria bacterium]